MDTRAREEAVEITATEHRALWYTGGMVSPEWMLPKALWLKRHAPVRYGQARYLVEMRDWLMYRLTGEWALSLSTVSGEWCYVREHGGWPDDLLDTLGLADLPSKWPERVLPPGTVIGDVSRGAAAVTGLPPGLPIVQGLMDSYAAALASNVFAPGRLSLSLGSSSSYLALTPSPRFDPQLCGPVPDAFGAGTWTVHGGQTSAAATLRWFRDQLAPGSSFVLLDEEAASVPPGSAGVGALDTLQGCRTPFRDPTSRGVFWGMNLGHRRGHLYRALLEAVAFGGRQVMETIQQAGVTIDEIVACGGGSRSSLWMHMHADVLHVPITVLDGVHAAALGAAMCAAVGTGRHSTLQVAARAMMRAGVTYRPDPERAAVYQNGFEGYRATYVAHQDLQRRRASFP